MCVCVDDNSEFSIFDEKRLWLHRVLTRWKAPSAEGTGAWIH